MMGKAGTAKMGRGLDEAGRGGRKALISIVYITTVSVCTYGGDGFSMLSRSQSVGTRHASNRGVHTGPQPIWLPLHKRMGSTVSGTSDVAITANV